MTKTALQLLNELHRQHHQRLNPDVPAKKLTSKTYQDNSIEGLTECIMDYIRLSSGWATQLPKTEVASQQPSLPDIMGVIDGQFIAVHVVGQNEPTEQQKEVGRAIRWGTGVWLIAEAFEQFYQALNIGLDKPDIPF